MGSDKVLSGGLNVDVNKDKESLTRGHGGDEWTGTSKIRAPRRGTVELESRTSGKS